MCHAGIKKNIVVESLRHLVVDSVPCLTPDIMLIDCWCWLWSSASAFCQARSYGAAHKDRQDGTKSELPVEDTSVRLVHNGWVKRKLHIRSYPGQGNISWERGSMRENTGEIFRQREQIKEWEKNKAWRQVMEQVGEEMEVEERWWSEIRWRDGERNEKGIGRSGEDGGRREREREWEMKRERD